MRVLAILPLAFLGISSIAFAQKADTAVILNCAEEVSEANALDSIKSMANGRTEGLEVGDLKNGLAKSKLILDEVELPANGQIVALIKNAKILAIQTPPFTSKRYCVVLEGEVENRAPRKD